MPEKYRYIIAAHQANWQGIAIGQMDLLCVFWKVQVCVGSRNLPSIEPLGSDLCSTPSATSTGKADVIESQEIGTLHTQAGVSSVSLAYYPEVISTQFLPLVITVCFILIK